MGQRHALQREPGTSGEPFPRSPVVVLVTTALAACLSTGSLLATWVEVRSPGFTVISNAGPGRARKVVKRLESSRQAITLWFPGLDEDPDPVRVFALAEEADMVAFTNGYVSRRDSVAGFFRRDEIRDDIVVTLDEDLGVLTHEYVHSLAQDALPGLPRWLNEGFATLWENSALSGRRLELGIPQRGYLRLLRRSKPVPLTSLLDPDGAAVLFGESHSRSLAYGQSWALTHYLLLGNEGRSWPRLLAFLGRCDAGADPVDAWTELFGPPEEMEAALSRYLESGRLPSRMVKIPREGKGGSYRTRELSLAEVRAYRGGFLARIGHLEAARALLEKSLAEQPTAIGHQGLGYVFLVEAELSGARVNLDAAIALDDDLHTAHYLAALVEYREAAPGWEERAEALLRASIRREPGFAPAFALLARVLDARADRLPLALEAARRAVESAPGTATYHLLLASLEGRAGDSQQAATSIGSAIHLADMSNASTALRVCWDGSLSGFAAEVMPACEIAVRRAPEPDATADGRAVARMLSGDVSGAITDLERFLASDAASDPWVRESRSAWLRELKAGRNPLDEETLEALRRSWTPRKTGALTLSLREPRRRSFQGGGSQQLGGVVGFASRLARRSTS